MKQFKYIEEKIFKVLMYLSLLIVAGFVFSVLWSILSKGLPVLTWEMVSSLPGSGFYVGKDGGFLNAIVGSLYIVLGATLIGLLISIPVVFYLNVYLKKDSKFGYIARLAFDVLFGIPSIVYGAFAFTIMILVGIRASLLGGIIVETLLIVPILIRSMDEERKRALASSIQSAFILAGARVDFSSAYDSWSIPVDAPLVKQALKADETMKVSQVHCGLECGVISDKYPDLQIISIGPNIHHPHSPLESVEIDSVERFWKLLLKIIYGKKE